MKLVSRVCENCGDKILGDSPKGLCPACLLETGLGPLAEEFGAGIDSSAVASAKADDPVHPVEVLMDFGDYELLEEIGRGGQGVVYRARQKSLNRTVALKVIGLGQWATQAHLKRFRREAESAANLDHPCIVPIYDVGEREGSCYFSMKFIDGGQLDEVTKRTPISPRTAAELIAKLARTVHYAHEHGILHRDIKPGNILVDAKGEPRLTDFGLARLLETKSTVTNTMDVLGTPSYMAPEQASGHNEQLTSATDVYGLGAVFYQLLTGHPPFAGGTTYETVRLVLETEPRQPRFWNPKIDRELSTICLKCLEKDPKRRYSSALALAEDLEHWLKHEPIRAKRSGFFTHSRKWVQRNPSIAALVTLSVALAAGLGVMTWNRGRESASPIAKSVAVLPFENLSGDPNNAYFADGIQEEILTRLASIADLKVISRTSTQRYQSRPRNLTEIAKQLGVANILEGSVQKTADQVRVNVQLVNALSDSHLWAQTYDRKLTDIFDVESGIAKGIADSLQAKLTGREGEGLAVKPTDNPEAYDAYLRGLAFEIRGQYSLDARRKVIDFYDRAVQLDPNFALAWARLSRACAFAYPVSDTSAARREAAKQALENAQKLKPNAPETLLALGYYQYRVLRDHRLAKTTFGLIRKVLPGSSEVACALGLVNRHEGNWDEGVAYLEQGLALDPQNPELLGTTARTYAMLRQFPTALKLLDRALDISPNDPDLLALKVRVYQAQGDLQAAAKLLVEINAETPSDSAFEAKLAQLTLERNHAEAVRLLQARLAHFHFGSEIDRGFDQVVLAFAQHFAGDSASAKVTAQQAHDTLEPLCKNQSDNFYFAATLALANAALGDKDSAIKEAERAIMLLPSAKDRVNGPGIEENLALIQAIFGENGRAISTLTRLLQTRSNGWHYDITPITPALLRLDPIWDPLRSDPAFQKLCEEKVDKGIAVLPFANLSRDPSNAYLAEGIQEEIITRLAKIADLKVISRTSTHRYQSEPRDLGEIAKQLGVANILEGSVQKAADQVRVNVQLINAQTDSHLWAETYDRKLTDIFSVESDVAKAIAERLQAKLTGQEEQIIAAKPTDNVEAYNAYLRGLACDLRMDAPRAQRYLREAVKLDPKFALAWALLSYVDARGYVQELLQPTDALRDEARQAAETALTLQPNLGEALIAKGQYHYACLKDYDTAVRYFEQARQLLPNNSRISECLANVTRKRGRWDESEMYFNEAERLDPRNVSILFNHARSDIHFRRFPEALRKFDQVLNITPDDVDTLALKASIAQAEGDLPRAAALLAPLHPTTAEFDMLEAQVYQAILERRPAPIIPRLKEILANPDPRFGYVIGELRFWLGWAQEVAGDRAAAQESWRQAHSELESFLKGQSEKFTGFCDLALISMGLGDKAAAFALTEQAMAALPIEKDAIVGPESIEVLARVAAQMGEPDRAIAALRQLLSMPYWGTVSRAPLTPALLRLDPMFDPLRSDPRFQDLCRDKQP